MGLIQFEVQGTRINARPKLFLTGFILSAFWEFKYIQMASPTPGTSVMDEGRVTARSSNQSILKEISPEYSLEGLMLKPKLHPIFWPPDVKN